MPVPAGVALKLAFLMLLSILFSAPVIGAQEVEGPLCPFCKTTGKLPNEFYESHKDLEKNALFCSYCIEEDKAGHGLPWVPCKRCKNKVLKEKAEAEFTEKVKVLKDWLVERRKVDETLKLREPCLHLRTEHFVWAWDIPRFKGEDKKIYNMHRGLHLYAERMENFYADFQRVHKISDKDNVNNLHQLFCFESQRPAVIACNVYAQMPTPNGKASKQGDPSVYVTWWNRNKMPDDADFHCDIIHNVNHLFTAVYKNHWWLHECGVAYEGGSHWWEIYYQGRACSRCFLETDGSTGWREYKWQAVVKKALMAGKHPRLADILTKPGTSLMNLEHPFAWSYIDYMMFMDPQKVMQFYLIVKQKKPPRDAFRAAFDMTVPAFEEAWQQYVMDNYSLQDDNPAVPKRFRRR